MRRYTVTVNGTDYVIDVEETSAATFRVQLGGRSLDVRLTDHQDLAQALISPDVEVGGAHPVTGDAGPAEGPVAPAPGPARPPAATTPPAPAARHTPAPRRPPAGPAGDLSAPMPGTVLSVSARAGDQVSRGDTLLVLEAMKMENALHSPRDGVVAEVLVEPGQQVRYGDLLVRFGDEGA